MSEEFIIIEKSKPLKGEVRLSGAKNAVLVIMASLLLAEGKSKLTNVPCSEDVLCMLELLTSLGAEVIFDKENKTIFVDTTNVSKYQVNPSLMKKMRASVLVMGPLLARFGKADIALPGGCIIGKRPIDYHLKLFKKMGVVLQQDGDYLTASASELKASRLILEYPSVGATENALMAATLTKGTTTIVNAALEPEVLDLISILRKMGAQINIEAPATIHINGVKGLHPVEHSIVCDRLEAGSILLAAAVTQGDVYLPDADANYMDVFLTKLEEMGHTIIVGENGKGIRLIATDSPIAVSFKTAPYPGFPTDLQAPMMLAQCLASGTSEIEETVFENRLVHIRELQKMGAQIKAEGNKAIITGVTELYGAEVIASDIRASCALVIAGLVAEGKTLVKGVHHFKRGYDALDLKLNMLGANISIIQNQIPAQSKLTEVSL